MKTETSSFDLFTAAHEFATSGALGFSITLVITVLVCAIVAKWLT